MATPTRIIIIGAGFAGLYAARDLAQDASFQITLIDRNNYHTFTPLLYQVATCALNASDIAYPVRTIFRHQHNVHFLLGEVTAIDYTAKAISVYTAGETRHMPYDYLLVAAGSVTNHFGLDSAEQYSFGLKDLDDAIQLRNHILKLFERAAWSDDAAEKDALTTLVVVGGGATGLETAGALHELYNYVLKSEYDDHLPKLRARVILLEATDKLLAPYPERLQQAAVNQLESLGVEVMLNAAVADVQPGRVILKDGRVLHTHTLIWAAGVKASPLATMLDVQLQRGGRIPVAPTMQVADRAGVYAAGDIAWLEDDKGMPYPMVIQVAEQQGVLVARNIRREIKAETLEAFRYHDLGIMATIGRSRAVAYIFNRIQLTGFIAWLGWLFLHLVTLMGFHNRMSVFVSWVWNYLTYDRSVRIIIDSVEERPRDVVQPSHTEQETA